MILCPLDEVPDDQEVTGEVHLVDDAEFVVESGSKLVVVQSGIAAIAEFEAFETDASKIIITRRTVFRFELGVAIDAGGVELDADVAFLGNFECGVAGLGNLRKEGAHFLGRFEIDLRRVGEAVCLKELAVGANADHDIVAFMICTIQEMDVVRGYCLEAKLFRPLYHLTSRALLRLHAMVVDLEVEVFFAEYLGELIDAPFGFEFAVGQKELIDLTIDAAAQTDETFAVSGERFFVDTWFVPHAIEVTFSDQFG